MPFESPVPLLSPEVGFKHERVPPPPMAYLTKDDWLAVSVYTTSTTTGLKLAYRFLDSAGQVHYGSEALDGASTSTLTKKVFGLTEGFMLGLTISNLGGGLADQVCFVVAALQRGNQATAPPHTVLTQGYVTDLFSVVWPPTMPRGPATGGGMPAAAAAGDTAYFNGAAWAVLSANTTATHVLQETAAGVPSWVDALAIWPGLANHPDRPPVSANAMDDEFDAGTLNARWTWDHQGDSAATFSNSVLHLTGGGQTDYTIRSLIQTLPSPPWAFTAKMAMTKKSETANMWAGLMLLESTSDKRLLFPFKSVSNYRYRSVTYFSAFGTFGGVYPYDESISWWGGRWVYARIARAGTALSFQTSEDGINFVEHLTEEITAHFDTAPNRVGLFVDGYAQTTVPMSLECDWFRRTT